MEYKCNPGQKKSALIFTNHLSELGTFKYTLGSFGWIPVVIIGSIVSSATAFELEYHIVTLLLSSVSTVERRAAQTPDSAHPIHHQREPFPGSSLFC